MFCRDLLIKEASYLILVHIEVPANAVIFRMVLPFSILKLKIVGAASGIIDLRKKLEKIGGKNIEFLGRLSEEDLKYKPSPEGRSIAETMDHVFGLSMVILNSAKKVPNDRTIEQEQPSKDELRGRTLANLKMASELIMASGNLAEHKIIFKNEKGTSEFPFWNQINGPIEDAVWHTGQIVLMRRAAGNPYNSKASVFTGKVRE